MGRGVKKAPASSSQIEDHPPPGILFGVVPSFLIVYWEMARGFGSWNWGEGVCQLGRWGQWRKSRYILKSQVSLILGNSNTEPVYLSQEFAKIPDFLGTGAPGSDRG